MSLEFNQNQHNSWLSGAHNISGSNDPGQFRHDLNSKLIKGALLASAGEAQGLSREQLIDQLNNNKRKNSGRGIYSGNWEGAEKVMEEENRIQEQITNEGDLYLSSTASDSNYEEYPNPFGNPQDDFQEFKRAEAVDAGIINELTESERQDRADAVTRDPSARSSLIRQIKELETIPNKPEGLIQALASLNRSAGIGSTQRDLDRSQVPQLLLQDATIRNPYNVKRNYDLAASEASDIGRRRFTIGGGGAAADQIFEAMARIKSLGTATGVDQFGQASPLRMENTINTPDTDQLLNAPSQGPLSATERWTVDNLPHYGVPGGRNFGPAQVNISKTSKDFVDRLSKITGYSGNKTDIRNIEEFRDAINYVIRSLQSQGKALGAYDAQSGKYVVSKNPGIKEALYSMNYTEKEQKDLANMLYQLRLSSPSQAKDRYLNRESGPNREVFTNTPWLQDPNAAHTPLLGVPYDRVRKNEKVGGKSVRASLAKLNQPDAHTPFIGAVEGEGPGTVTFLSRKGAQMTPEQRISKWGPKGELANALEAKHKAYEIQRARNAYEQYQISLKNPPNTPQRNYASADVPLEAITQREAALKNKQPPTPAYVSRAIDPNPNARTGPVRNPINNAGAGNYDVENKRHDTIMQLVGISSNTNQQIKEKVEGRYQELAASNPSIQTDALVKDLKTLKSDLMSNPSFMGTKPVELVIDDPWANDPQVPKTPNTREEKVKNILTQLPTNANRLRSAINENLTSPKYQGRRRIGYGIGGGLLAGMAANSLINDETDRR